jgi:hypothetical protein
MSPPVVYHFTPHQTLKPHRHDAVRPQAQRRAIPGAQPFTTTSQLGPRLVQLHEIAQGLHIPLLYNTLATRSASF